MPTKGFFTQGVAVLSGRNITLGDIEPLLGAFKIVKRNEDFKDWAFSGPSLTIEYKPEVNGYVSVDIVDRAWPGSHGRQQK